ncbi:MAG TPA: hypothetical protein VKY36_01310 [Moheibacter sp.]|nr:hypothetical protein [Moheibacter sp.]
MSEKIKIDLIEDFTQHYLQTTSLPPLATKIFSFLLVDGEKDGYTFDEFVDIFKVSKSSVSSSLNMLIKSDYIAPYNKIGERKRRYKITEQLLPLRLKRTKKELIREKYLSEKLMQYRSETTKTMDSLNVEKGKIYVTHLENAIERLEETIDRLEKLTHKI